MLDVVVTDRQGNFVGGLAKADFTLQEDKVTQQIRSFQVPEAHAPAVDAPVVQSSADLTQIGNAPVTILVLDELNTQFSDLAFARDSMEKWLERQPSKLLQQLSLWWQVTRNLWFYMTTHRTVKLYWKYCESTFRRTRIACRKAEALGQMPGRG
jgi:hypothetical protein